MGTWNSRAKIREAILCICITHVHANGRIINNCMAVSTYPERGAYSGHYDTYIHVHCTFTLVLNHRSIVIVCCILKIRVSSAPIVFSSSYTCTYTSMYTYCMWFQYRCLPSLIQTHWQTDTKTWMLECWSCCRFTLRNDSEVFNVTRDDPSSSTASRCAVTENHTPSYDSVEVLGLGGGALAFPAALQPDDGADSTDGADSVDDRCPEG